MPTLKGEFQNLTLCGVQPEQISGFPSGYEPQEPREGDPIDSRLLYHQVPHAD